MTSADLMHGITWTGENVSGFYACEKFDGHRAFWDGETLWTRQGVNYHAPAWFTAHLPKAALDCELMHRDGPNALANLHRSDPERWRGLRLVIFDMPQAGGDYAERLSAIRALGLPAVEMAKVQTTAEARQLANAVGKRGGEGLILHAPGTPYAFGKRTQNLLKLFPDFVDDCA